MAERSENLLRAERSDVLASSLHAVAALVLHLTGDHRLPKSQRERYVKQLQLLLELEQEVSDDA